MPGVKEKDRIEVRRGVGRKVHPWCRCWWFSRSSVGTPDGTQSDLGWGNGVGGVRRVVCPFLLSEPWTGTGWEGGTYVEDSWTVGRGVDCTPVEDE